MLADHAERRCAQSHKVAEYTYHVDFAVQSGKRRGLAFAGTCDGILYDGTLQCCFPHAARGEGQGLQYRMHLVGSERPCYALVMLAHCGGYWKKDGKATAWGPLHMR